MQEYETVSFDKHGHVATIMMNRPERRNALNSALLQDLLSVFEQARDDGEVRAILLGGAGKGFCAGADLSGFQQRPTPEQVYETIVDSYQPLIGLMTRLPKPVIAAVNGTAAGAGASLALACDLRVMADDASIMMAFSNVGLVPDGGASWLLTRLVGYSRAYEMAIEGRPIPADRCMEWGLTNKVVPAETLMETARNWAATLAGRPTLALGLTKHTLSHAARHDVEASIEYEARLQKQTIPSFDHMEGVAAFTERRDPQFRGE